MGLGGNQGDGVGEGIVGVEDDLDVVGAIFGACGAAQNFTFGAGFDVSDSDTEIETAIVVGNVAEVVVERKLYDFADLGGDGEALSATEDKIAVSHQNHDLST